MIGPSIIAKEYAKVIRESYPQFGLIVDLSHIPLLRESSISCIQSLADYIVHIHIGNCVMRNINMPAFGDQHPRFGFPDSEIDAPQLSEFLNELLHHNLLNGSIVVSFEVKPFQLEDSEVVIANSKRTLNEAWAKLSRN